MKTLLTKVVDLGYSGWAEIRELRFKMYVYTRPRLTSASEGAVGPAFVSKLWRVRLAGFLEKRCQVRQVSRGVIGAKKRTRDVQI